MQQSRQPRRLLVHLVQLINLSDMAVRYNSHVTNCDNIVFHFGNARSHTLYVTSKSHVFEVPQVLTRCRCFRYLPKCGHVKGQLYKTDEI